MFGLILRCCTFSCYELFITYILLWLGSQIDHKLIICERFSLEIWSTGIKFAYWNKLADTINDDSCIKSDHNKHDRIHVCTVHNYMNIRQKKIFFFAIHVLLIHVRKVFKQNKILYVSRTMNWPFMLHPASVYARG